MIAGIEVALWDILGKSLGVPVLRRPLFGARAIDSAQPDLRHVGGFTEARKIATMAEAAGVAALHFDVAPSNLVIQEEMIGAVSWYEEVLRGPIRMVGGHWQVPEAPGLGVESDEAVAARHPFKQEILAATEAVLPEGAIVDW